MQTKKLLQAISAPLKKRNIQVISLGDPEVGSAVHNWIPTSSIILNSILGGGIPCGRVTEIFGEESNGKSTLVADVMANAQKMGGLAVIIDSEQSFAPERAASMGVNIDNVVYSDEITVEGAFAVIEGVLEEVKEEDCIVCIVWDSVAQSVTQAELDASIIDHNVGAKAKGMTRGINRIIDKLGTKTALIVTNQMRDKIGGTSWGKSTQTPGGWALKHNASVRIELSRAGKILKDEVAIGIKCRAYTVKNKVYAPFKTANYDVLFKGGIDDTEYLLTALVKAELITQGGSWYTDQAKKKFQRKDFKEYLVNLQKTNLESYQKFIEAAIKQYA